MSLATMPSPAPQPDPDLLPRLFALAPLPSLLEATGAEIVEVPITDAAFLGGVLERSDGSIFLSMPPDRPAWQREYVARDLLARIVGVLLPGRLPTQDERAA